MTKSVLALLLAVAGIACSDNPSEPQGCPAGTTSLDASITKTGSSVVFDWSPRCPVALLLVEDNAHDVWAINAPGFSESSTTDANVILPAVTYGQVPAGTVASPAAATLVAGTTYDLVLWMVVPSSTSCSTRVQNACLVTVKAFVR